MYNSQYDGDDDLSFEQKERLRRYIQQEVQSAIQTEQAKRQDRNRFVEQIIERVRDYLSRTSNGFVHRWNEIINRLRSDISWTLEQELDKDTLDSLYNTTNNPSNNIILEEDDDDYY